MQELKEFLGQALTPNQKEQPEDPEIQTDEEKALQLNAAINEAAEGKSSPAKQIIVILKEVFTQIHEVLQSEDGITETAFTRHDTDLHVKRYGFTIEKPQSLNLTNRYSFPNYIWRTKFTDFQQALKEVLLSIGIIESNSGDSVTINKAFKQRDPGDRRVFQDKLRIVVSKAEHPPALNMPAKIPKSEKGNELLHENIDFDLLHMVAINTGHPFAGTRLKSLFSKKYTTTWRSEVCVVRRNSFALEVYRNWHPDREVRRSKECFNWLPRFGRASYEVLEAYLKTIGLL